jgi:benzoyl-CoA reductase subunit B
MAADQTRLRSVDAVRTPQRQWLEETRRQVLAGGEFAICNADDFEEVFTAFDIPTLVINYWNSIITFSERKGPHFEEVLEAHGYVPHNFGLGFASSLEPARAPWGGLPKPTMIVGTTRDEAQLRVTELWARQFGCDCYPLDFSWVSQFSRELPPEWWTYHRDRSEEMLDLDRVEQRLEQLKNLIAYLEVRTGRPFSLARFREVMELLNQQMDLWQSAMDMIASARPLPVSLRDQMAIYQVTWQRGTRRNLELVQAFYDEVQELVAAGAACYPAETFRIYMATSGNDPLFHAYVRERYGGAIVSNRYSSIAPMYARNLKGDDPLRALASRQLFLFDKEPHWEVAEARRWGAHGIISLEPERDTPSRYKEVCEAAGFAHLGIPKDADTPEIRARIDEFVTTRLLKR